ncbi:MAG TPA: glycoside hydrolase family 3 N-terminal domain-containing protein, partial [Lentimicrobium sp.]|nr:glycoside hydrolase family 3 N-terminal domain-containing protein [Lentimicrobium sp.]
MRHRFKYTLFLSLLAFLISVYAGAQPGVKEQWADSVMMTLTPDERIAQLLMIRAYSNRDEKYYDELTALVRENNIGGVCFFQGGPVRQAIVTNRLQNAVKTPLFVALDAEWGPGMRLDSVFNFPKQMTLGAVTDNNLIYDMGTEIARQLKRLGVHINFAPVADINNNPLNPVINARSFGEDRVNVAGKAYWYMKGMQDQGIIAVAKHFPGHGDTGNDSHYTLPLIDKPRAVIDTLELFPFSYLIERGLKGIMIAHLRVPSIDTAAGSVSSLSRPVITELLREKMGFTGMV